MTDGAPVRRSIYPRALLNSFLFAGALGALGALSLAISEDALVRALLLGLGVPTVGMLLVFLIPLQRLRRSLATIQWSLDRIRAGDMTADLPPTMLRESEAYRTALVAMRDEVLRARALLEARDRERRRLYAHVVHDMATPLTTLMMSTDGLAKGATTEQIARIESELDSLRELVESLRMLSVMEHPDFVAKPEAIALRAFLDDLGAAYPIAAALVVDADELTVFACPRVLKAALRNLIDNAVGASRGAPVTVTANRQPGGGCEIRIVDGGPGFAQTGDGLEAPLEPPRLPNGIRSSGLGLMIARAAVARLGGSLALANRPEGGGQVTLVIPSCTAA